MKNRKNGQTMSATRRLVLSAVFAALAFVVMLTFRFKVQFLTFDLKDTVITIAGLLLGPVAALSVSLLIATLELILVSDTGLYGFIMNFASSAIFSVVAALVYRYRKKLSGAILGLVGGGLSMIGVMLLLNLLITPIYYTKVIGVPMSTTDVAGLIPGLLLPFNAVKALANVALVLTFYKPISRAMQAARLMPSSDPVGDAPRTGHRWVSIVVPLVGLCLLVMAFLFFSLVLKGNIELFH